MSDSCEIYMDDLEQINKQIKNLSLKVDYADDEMQKFYIEQTKELVKQRDEIVKKLNVCTRNWSSI